MSRLRRGALLDYFFNLLCRSLVVFTVLCFVSLIVLVHMYAVLCLISNELRELRRKVEELCEKLVARVEREERGI